VRVHPRGHGVKRGYAAGGKRTKKYSIKSPNKAVRNRSERAKTRL